MFFSFPLYGSPGGTINPTAWTESFWYPILGFVIPIVVISFVLFIFLFGVFLGEYLWYRRHKTIQEGVENPKKSLMKRFFFYWIGASIMLVMIILVSRFGLFPLFRI